jgi:hypothetical protein
MRAPEARGLPEGTRRKPDTDGRADQEGVRYGGAPLRAPRQNLFLNFGSPHLAAQRTLVVKISDTSHHGKSGFESRL